MKQLTCPAALGIALLMLTAPEPAPAQGGKFIGAWLVLNDPMGQSKLAKVSGYSCSFSAVAEGEKFKYKGTVIALKDGRMRVTLTVDVGDGKPQETVLICDGKQVAGYKVEKGQLVAGPAGDAPDKVYAIFTTLFFRGGSLPAFTILLEQPSKASSDKLKLEMVTDDKADKVGDTAARLIEYKLVNKEKETSFVAKLWLDKTQELPLKRELDAKAPKQALHITETYSDWQLDPKVKDDDFKHPAK